MLWIYLLKTDKRYHNRILTELSKSPSSNAQSITLKNMGKRKKPLDKREKALYNTQASVRNAAVPCKLNSANLKHLGQKMDCLSESERNSQRKFLSKMLEANYSEKRF